MLRRTTSIALLATLLCQPFLSLPGKAQVLNLDPGFDPNHVLDNSDIFDVNGMSYQRLVDFLRSRGTLGNIQLTDIDGVMRSPADIIWRVATSYKINPKYLLVLIQKEQSLVDDLDPSQKQFDWATGYAICDACSKDDPEVQQFKGFASQLEWAAKQHREKYLLQILTNGTTRAGRAAGKTITIDGISVTPTNDATAMLYSYTPHINGNLNLWRIWRKWFSLVYPDGTVVQSKTTGKIYLIKFGQKRIFATHAVAETLVDPDKVISISDTELNAYPDGPQIQFPKYALLRDSTHRVWLLTTPHRRLIVDAKAFHKFGFNEDEIEDVDDADLASYPIGEPITTKTEFPQGIIEQDITTKSYWYIEDSIRHLIPDKIFLSLYFQGRNIKKVSAKTINSYKLGAPYALHDGELVRTVKKPAVYVIEEGALRAIPNAETFQTIGWDWKNVVTVPDAVLTGYTIGNPFTLQSLSVASSTDATSISL